MHVEECGYLGGLHGVQGCLGIAFALPYRCWKTLSSHGYLDDEAFFVNSKPKLLLFHFFLVSNPASLLLFPLPVVTQCILQGLSKWHCFLEAFPDSQPALHPMCLCPLLTMPSLPQTLVSAFSCAYCIL